MESFLQIQFDFHREYLLFLGYCCFLDFVRQPLIPHKTQMVEPAEYFVSSLRKELVDLLCYKILHLNLSTI